LGAASDISGRTHEILEEMIVSYDLIMDEKNFV
jgi:hypothetical protein